MKRGKFKFSFTMIEIVFVIILLGILSQIGSTFLPDNRLLNDTNFLILKIKEKQRDSIKYDENNFKDAPWSHGSKHTCIELNSTVLENEDLDAQKPYKFNSTIILEEGRTLCFDAYGRPYRNLEEKNLLLNSMEIRLVHKTDAYNIITIMPISGYIIMKDNL